MHEYPKCVTGQRCIRCRKINLLRASQDYQKKRAEIFATADSGSNILIAATVLEDLLNQRAKLGRMARNIENMRRKERIEQVTHLFRDKTAKRSLWWHIKRPFYVVRHWWWHLSWRQNDTLLG